MIQNDLYASLDKTGIVFMPVNNINELRLKTSINGTNTDGSLVIMNEDNGSSIWKWDNTSILLDNGVTVVKVITIPVGRWINAGIIHNFANENRINITTATSNSTTDNIIANFNPSITALKDGLEIFVLVNLANIGITSITVNSLSILNIVKYGNVDLIANDIRQNHLLHLVYSQFYNKWVLLNPDYSSIINNSINATTDIKIKNIVSNIPLYPKILTSTMTMPVTSTGTQVIISSGTQFLMNGSLLFNTSDYLIANRTFNTVANKTYHLRFDVTNGFTLKDLSDVNYNISALAETDISFDSTYSNMLIARIVTNSTGVITITLLKNDSGIMNTGWYGTQYGSITTTLVRLTAGGTCNFARIPNDITWNAADFNLIGAVNIGSNVIISINRYSPTMSATFNGNTGAVVLRAKFQTL